MSHFDQCAAEQHQCCFRGTCAGVIIVRAPYCVSFFGTALDHARLAESGERASALCGAVAQHAYAQIQPAAARPSMQAPHHPLVREMLARHGANLPTDIDFITHIEARFARMSGGEAAFASAALLATLGAQGRHCGRRDIACGVMDIAPALPAHDVIASAYGGLHRIDVEPNGAFRASPLRLSPARRQALEKRLLLVSVEVSPAAMPQNALRHLTEIVGEGQRVLENPLAPLSRLGRLMHKAWRLSHVAPEAAVIYDAARAAGAVGGQCNGDTLLLYAPPRRIAAVRDALVGLPVAPVQFDRDGAFIIAYEPDYEAALARA